MACKLNINASLAIWSTIFILEFIESTYHRSKNQLVLKFLENICFPLFVFKSLTFCQCMFLNRSLAVHAVQAIQRTLNLILDAISEDFQYDIILLCGLEKKSNGTFTKQLGLNFKSHEQMMKT